MQLVMNTCEGDGFTYWCTNTYQIEAPSAEEALCELERLVMSVAHGTIIEFYGWSLDTRYFSELSDPNNSTQTFAPPEISTVDEWFAQRYPAPPPK